jgi:hypothetical protein
MMMMMMIIIIIIIIIIIKVRGFFRLRNVNIVGFFAIYLIATCFGHTTIFKLTYFL